MARERNRSTPPAASEVSARVPTILLDLVAIEELPLALWRRVFEVVGYPSGLSPTNLSHAAIIDHVGGGDVSEQLIEVLQVLHDIGTESGLEAMNAVAEAHQCDLGQILVLPPREAAVQLWLSQRADPAMQELFTRVQMQAETRREPRAFREYVGKTARAVPEWKGVQERLRQLVQALCKEEGFGDHVDVRGYLSDGDVRVQIVHAYRLQRPVVVRDGDAGRGTIAIRPVHCDIVRYDAARAWLRVSPKSTSNAILERYRRMVGEAFFTDPDFFSSAQYTLRPLQLQGRAALDDSAGIVINARLVELQWERSDEQVMWLKAPDCFHSAEELGLPLEEGTLVEAKIAVRLIGKRSTRRTVKVKVPNRVEFPRDEHEAAIEGFLRRSGIQAATTVAPHRDLWSLAPWHHEQRTWREAYARDVDPLVKRGVLVQRPMAKVAHPDHQSAGRVLEVDAAGEFGAATDDAVPPRLVTASDVAGLDLKIDHLAAAWRADLELHGDVRHLGGSAMWLGRRRLDSIDCSLVALMRKPSETTGAALALRIRDAVGDERVAVMVPAGRSSDTGLPEIGFDRLTLDPRSVWREFVRANKLMAKVEAIWSASLDARLVIDRRRQLVWLDGLLVNIPSESHPFKLLVVLASARGAVVSHTDIGAALSAKRGDAEDVSKKAKHQAKMAITRSFAAAARPIDADAIICSAAGGYRLAVPSDVVPPAD